MKDRFQRINRKERCPGETKCQKEILISAKGESLEEKASKACPNCELFETKLNPKKGLAIENLLLGAERWREVRNSGFEYQSSVTWFQFHAMLALDKYEKQLIDFERHQQLETLLILKAAFTKN